MKLLLKFSFFGLVLCSLIGLLASILPILDLFNHFRPQAVIASVIICLASIFWVKKLLLPSFMILAVNSVLFALPLQSVTHVAPLVDEQHSITVTFANVLKKNPQHEKTLSVITRENPDIIALAEVDEKWLSHFDGLSNYSHKLRYPKTNNFGLAVYSKLPFESEVIEIGHYKTPLAILTFQHFDFVVAHPVPPLTMERMRENSLYIEEIAALVSASQKPFIVAGDLNSTLWSKMIKPLFDAGLQRIGVFAYTWPAQNPLLALQIDHILVRGIPYANLKTLDAIGSDHFPIQATLAVPH